MSETPLNIGIVGLGTVGGGVMALLEGNAALIARRANRPLKITAVCARDRHAPRPVDIGGYAWEDDAQALATRPDVDVVVELVGGADGPALALARTTLKAGRHMVSANKAMLAHHGLELAALAEDAGVALKFEAAVAGGIPAIKTIREGLAANHITRISGILNGTCNYLLTQMERQGWSFAQALDHAQMLGYAEADPSFDIDGVDAGHKLAILSSLAFGTRPHLAGVAIDGVRAVTLADIDFARTLGFRIRLVGQARRDADGALMQRVCACLTPLTHPLAHVWDATNAVVFEGDFVGRVSLQGPGAGAGPTASAVVADLIDIARGEWGPAFAMTSDQLVSAPAADPQRTLGRSYIRLQVSDKPGVLADITAALRDADVSVESVIQRAHEAGDATLVIVTHPARLSALTQALTAITALPVLRAPPLELPILDA